MSFYTCPKIDLNAERSEDSVLKTRNIFSKKNGFVSHEVNGTQDYGVDIYVQLTENSDVLGGMVPLQIKSAKKGIGIFKRIGSFLSLQFQTSRFGHLCRHSPYYGIIIFYDEDSEKLYYDYVWELYKRILNEKKGNSWKYQKTVNIHFPIENILDSVSIIKIKETFLNIYYNNKRLINDFGIDYDIPVPEKENKKLNFDEKQAIIDNLEINGVDLFNSHQYKEIVSLIENLSVKDMASRHKLLFLAAVSYTEVGLFLDADFYLSKCFKNKHLFNVDLKEILELQKIKVDFSFGRYDDTNLLNKLCELRENIVNPDNIANIEHFINMLQLKGDIGNSDFDKKDIEHIEKGFETIENNTTSETQKQFQKVFQSELLLHAINRIYADYINNCKLYPFGPNRERLELFQFIYERHLFILDVNEKAIHFSYEKKIPLLEAHAKFNQSKLIYSIHFSNFLNQQIPTDFNSIKTHLEESLNYAIESYNLFIEMSLQREAYLSIREAYEVYRLSEEYIHIQMDYIMSLNDIKEKIAAFTNYEFYSQHQSTIDFFCSTHRSSEKTIDYSDEALEEFAYQVLKTKNLPQERINNLKNELRSYRDFNIHCKNKELILLTNQAAMKDELLWEKQSKYRIANNITGEVYLEGNNVMDMP